MEIVEKEGDLPVFDTDSLNAFFFFFPTAEITAQLMGKIGANLPAAEELKKGIFFRCACHFFACYYLQSCVMHK